MKYPILIVSANVQEMTNKLLLCFTPFKSTAGPLLLTRVRTRFEILNNCLRFSTTNPPFNKVEVF